MTAQHDWESLEEQTAEEVIDFMLSGNSPDRVAFTCSFQVEDIVVLHLLRKRLPDVPVLFLETGYHFPETYRFRDQVTRDWSLNLINVIPQQTVREQESRLGILYRYPGARISEK